MPSVNTIDVKKIAPELGSFFIASSIIFFLFMRKIRGKLYFTETYIASRAWDFLKSPEKLLQNIGILKFIIVSILFWPCIALLSWTGTLLYVQIFWGEKYETVLGISTFLVCSSIFLILAGCANLKWQCFKINKSSLWMIGTGSVAYVGFQFVVIFMGEKIDFVGVSAIFISANGILMLILIFFMETKGGTSISQVVSSLTVQQDLLSDINTLFSIPKGGEEYQMSAVCGGIQALYTNPRYQNRKKEIVSAIFLLSEVVLIIYSLISYYYCDFYALGILNSILISFVDLLVFLYIYTGVVQAAYIPVLLSLTSRFFIYILTGYYWFIGYSCVYFLFSLVLWKHIVDSKYPLLTNIVQLRKAQVNVAKTCEFLSILSIAIYILLIVYISLRSPIGVPLTKLIIQGYDFQLFVIGICNILLSLIACSFLMAIRLVKRKIRGISDITRYYLFNQDFDTFWIVSLIGTFVSWACGVAVYLTCNSQVLITIFSIFPVICFLLLGFYANWIKNDCEVVKDPAAANSKIQKKIKEEEILLKKVEDYQEKILQSSGLDASAMKISVDMSASRNISKRNFANPKEAQRARLGFIEIDKLRGKIPELMPNWCESMSVAQAFFSKKLLKSDYINISLLSLSVLLACIMAGIIYGIDEEMKYGVTIAILIICLLLILLPLQGSILTSSPLSGKEYLSIGMGIVLNYGYGYLYYHFQLKQNSDSAECGLNVFFNTFALPVLISYAYGLVKWKDDKWKISNFSIVALSLAQIFSFSGAILIIIVVDLAAGIALFSFYSAIAIYILLAYFYSKNNFQMPKLLKIFTVLFTILISSAGVAFGIAYFELGIYQGCSITFLFLCLLFIGFSIIKILIGLNKANTIPVFFSPWVFPIYTYNPAKEKIERADEMGLHLFIGLGLVICWSVSCVIWLSPTAIGVSVGCLCEILIVFMIVFISGISPLQLGEAFVLMNPEENRKTLKKAWDESKKSYLEKNGAGSTDDFPNYFDCFLKIKDLHRLHNEKKCEVPTSRNKAWEHLNTPMKGLRDLYTEFYLEDKRTGKQYMNELELMVHFQLLIVLTAFSSKVNEILLNGNLMVTKAAELRAFGIVISLQDGGTGLVEKYAHMLKEIGKLDHIQRSRFENIKEDYLNELESLRLQRKEQEAEAKKAHEQRMQTMKTMHEQKKQKLLQQSTSKNIPIDEMVDSIEKYKKIVEEYKRTGVKFVDKQFPANDSSLGSHTKANTSGWDRKDSCSLYEGGVTPNDVKQGAIGDCYLLSAMSVLGGKRLEEIFLEASPDPKCGAYLMKFYQYGDPVYVIVDDYFPVNSQGKWAFAQTTTGTELWPMLLEKGFAKLNNGYDNIVAGKVHYALADMTGGEPEEVKLESLRDNPEKLWSKLIKSRDCLYPMGAGSPENPNGDLAVSENGIVQGHAYAVLNAQDFDSEKLIQLKNPHGDFGQEWRGDWSDGSSKWTKKAISKLNYSNSQDGIFWMSLEDFVWEFKNLYICRIFDDPKWKKFEVKGEWTGKKAAGFPCKDNPQAKVEDNPQYLFTVTKPCTAFIVLTQKSVIDMFKGKNPILFLVYNIGKKVSDVSKNLVGSSGKPIDLRIVSAEISLEKGSSYVILVTSMYQGEKGSGQFELNVNVDDQKASLIEI